MFLKKRIKERCPHPAASAVTLGQDLGRQLIFCIFSPSPGVPSQRRWVGKRDDTNAASPRVVTVGKSHSQAVTSLGDVQHQAGQYPAQPRAKLKVVWKGLEDPNRSFLPFPSHTQQQSPRRCSSPLARVRAGWCMGHLLFL